MLIINYDPEKGQAVRDSQMNFKLRDALMRAELPHIKGKRSFSLHIGSLLFVRHALNLIKNKQIKHNAIRFEYYNNAIQHSKDGRFISLPKTHPMRVLDNIEVEFNTEEEIS